MSLSKPIKTTIHASDFQDGTYSFTVESVLGPDETTGIVVVSTSVGYSLIISPTGRPGREHIIRYSQQTDGGWVAHAVLTLLAPEASPVNGTVSIRAGAETTVLTIDKTSSAIEHPQSPVLTVDPPVLTFAGVSLRKPGYQVITIAHHANAPVTLTTDAPDTFQLATDSQPTFAPVLTVVPLPTGTHVHVRCVSSQRRAIAAQLTITSRYETKTVALQSYQSSLLPTTTLRVTRQWGGLLALVVVGGLAYAGYVRRCELFPSLCPNTLPQSLTETVSPALVDSADASRKTSVAGRGRTRPSPTPAVLPRRRDRAVDAVARSGGQPVSDAADNPKAAAADRSFRAPQVPGEPLNQAIGSAADGRLRRRTTPVPPDDESELERELNQPMQNRQ